MAAVGESVIAGTTSAILCESASSSLRGDSIIVGPQVDAQESVIAGSRAVLPLVPVELGGVAAPVIAGLAPAGVPVVHGGVAVSVIAGLAPVVVSLSATNFPKEDSEMVLSMYSIKIWF